MEAGQSIKADSLMQVTEAGIKTEVKPVQPSKAKKPIFVTEAGMETAVKPLQPQKE